MGKIYRDIQVEIPGDASISYSDRRVYITTQKNYLSEKGFNENKRLVIGQYIDARSMHPNDNYNLQSDKIILVMPLNYERTA